MNRILQGSRSTRGMAVLTALLLVLIILLSASIILPYAVDFVNRAVDRSCELALETANREIKIAWLLDPVDFSADDARAAVKNIDTLCPTGGRILIVPTEGALFDEEIPPYRAICSRHSDDAALWTPQTTGGEERR